VQKKNVISKLLNLEGA